MQKKENWAFLYVESDHLGNVRVTISDLKKWKDTNVNAVPDGGEFSADVTSYNSYYAFGSIITQRTSPVSTKPYRYGFNGQEMDGEVYAVAGSLNTAEFWEYDTRLGRRWNMDPVDKAWMSPYHALSNKPITNIDPNGAVDDYNIDVETRKVTVTKTDDKFDTFTLKEGDKSISTTTMKKNEFGLVKFPESGVGFNHYNPNGNGGQYSGEKTRKGKCEYTWSENVGEGDRYLKPKTAAALLGLSYSLNTKYGIYNLSLGDMSTYNGSDPGSADFHHGGHGHLGSRIGLDIDFRYLNENGNSFQNSSATTDKQFSWSNNLILYYTAQQWGFKNNYYGKKGSISSFNLGAKPMEGHDNHGHLGFSK